MYDIALILWRSLMYHESYSYLTKGLELLNKESSDDIELQLSYYETAGKVAVRLADYEKAITHYQLAITTIENSGQDFSERLATIYDKLGVVMRKASKYEQALDYFTKAQNIIDINHIKNPELTSDIYNDMGVIYINLDIFDKALANYQKAREIRESVENPDLEQIAYSYHNIGTVYQRQKKYADAITWHKKALEIRQEIYPDNEPIIAASLTMIGNDYTQAAKNDSSYHFNDAFEYFAKGLEIRKLTLGETHPDTAWSYQSIGLWHFYQGEYEEAIENYLKCLSIRKTILQPSHAYIAEISYLLGEAYLKINQIHSAKEHLLLFLYVIVNVLYVLYFDFKIPSNPLPVTFTSPFSKVAIPYISLETLSMIESPPSPCVYNLPSITSPLLYSTRTAAISDPVGTYFVLASAI